MKIFNSLFIIIFISINCLKAQSFEMEIIKDGLDGSNGILFQDFNDDGKREYVVARYSQDVVTLVYDDGNGFVERDLITIDQPSDITYGDFNQDGRMDIALTAANASGIRILQNIGNLEFTVQTLNSFDFDEGSNLVSSDFDNDGDLDLVVTSHKNDQLTIFEMKNPSFLSFDVITVDNNVDNTGEVNVTDFNNDGNLDIVLSVRFGNEVNVYLNDGNLNFNKISMSSAGAVGNDFADFNQDGLMDFAVSSFSNSDVLIYINNGDDTFEEYLIDGSAQSANDVECFDINMDGYPDIVVGSSEGIFVYILDDVNGFQFIKEEYFYDGWVGPFDVVDVDNDNDLDIVASSTALPGIIHFNNLTINSVDNDNDGFNSDVDCDDDNADINPDAEEIPDNGIDEDCDGNDLSTSTFEISDESVKIYPNPVSHLLKIDVSGNLKYRTKIYDINGILIYNQSNNQFIDVTFFDNGIYILEIQDTNSKQKILDRIIISK